PREAVQALDKVFSLLDLITETHGIDRVQTSGVYYIAAAGIPDEDDHHAQAIARFAVDARKRIDHLRDTDPL
ncbi:unnamed protein product, partial [Amoebophrya sp. A120]